MAEEARNGRCVKQGGGILHGGDERPVDFGHTEGEIKLGGLLCEGHHFQRQSLRARSGLPESRTPAGRGGGPCANGSAGRQT